MDYKKLYLVVLTILLLSSPFVYAVDSSKNIVKFGSSIVVDERDSISGDVFGISSDIRVYGEVKGTVIAIGGRLEVGKTAVINNGIVAICREYSKDIKATINGSEVDFSSHLLGKLFDTIKLIISNIVLLILFFVIGIILMLWSFIYLVTNVDIEKVVATIKDHTMQSILYGFILTITFFVLLLICIVSIVGIVLIPPLMILFFTVSFIGYIAIGYYVGKLVSDKFNWQVGMFLQTIIGCVILAVITVIPVIGAAVYMVVWFAGLGGILKILTKQHQPQT